MHSSVKAPDEKAIRIVLDRLDPRALTRALLGPRPRRRRGGPTWPGCAAIVPGAPPKGQERRPVPG